MDILEIGSTNYIKSGNKYKECKVTEFCDYYYVVRYKFNSLYRTNHLERNMIFTPEEMTKNNESMYLI